MRHLYFDARRNRRHGPVIPYCLEHQNFRQSKNRSARVVAVRGLCFGLRRAVSHEPIYPELEREILVPVPVLGLGNEPPVESSTPEGADDDDPFRDPSEEPASKVVESPTVPSTLPNVVFRTVTEKYWEAFPESEWAIAREMTIGGSTRLADGQLRRTYSGVPPSMCPT